MKKFTKTVFTVSALVGTMLLMTPPCANAQPYTINGISITGSNSPFAKNITTLDGGTMVILLTQDSINPSYQPTVLMKLDASNNVEWTQSYGPYGQFGDIVQCPDSSYVINNNDGFATYCVFKVDKNGVLLYAKRFLLLSGDQLAEVGDCVAGMDGSVYCSGVVGYTTTGYRHLFKLDANGNLLFSNYYLGGSGQGTSLNLHICANGDVLMLGSYIAFLNNTWYNSAIITKVDSTGAEIVSKNYYAPNSSISPYDCVVNASEDIYMMGSIPTAPFLMKINSTSNVAWVKTLSGTQALYPRVMMETPEGDLVVSGSRMFFKTDTSGAILSARSYPNFQIQSIDVLSPTMYQITGSPDTASLDMYLMTTNANGESCSDSALSVFATPFSISDSSMTGLQPAAMTVTNDSMQVFQPAIQYTTLCIWSTVPETETEQQTLSLFPNPAKDFVNIQSTDDILTVELYDPLGRLIQQMKVNSNNYTLEIHSQLPGLYLLRIAHETHIESRRLIIEQ